MSLSEFTLIDRYFAAQALRRGDVVIGIGDDAAVVEMPAGQQLVVAADTLVAGVHFPVSADAADIGHKALAVNLSDLAAMGARPAWATLALTLPAADAAWLEPFARGLFALADRAGVALVGGDTTRGPLTITLQMLGWVPKGAALRRAGARPGDPIYVSGSLGDAALALRLLSGELTAGDEARAQIEARLHRPEPRLALGERLRGVASAAIDISDGLLADLGHLLDASGVGATLWADRLPRSAAFRSVVPGPQMPAWFELPLAGGDDYELCFTVPLSQVPVLTSLADELGLPLTAIGEIQAEPGLRCLGDDGRDVATARRGYEHFGG
ncbi:MAG: thiamine-phosphate kinase [Gammaproteobacteria bacterium]